VSGRDRWRVGAVTDWSGGSGGPATVYFNDYSSWSLKEGE
jgi:hypothetical protein